MLLSYNQEEEPVQFVEDFLNLPQLKPFDLFSLYFIRDTVLRITTETLRYARLQDNHNFHVSDNDIYQSLGWILISGYDTFPREKGY